MKFKFVTILIALAALMASCDTENNPVNPATGSDNYVQVVNGDGFTLALDNNGNVWAWGTNTSGELAQPAETLPNSSNPVQIQGINNIMKISAGDKHCLALNEDGKVYAWGANDQGQLGNGKRSDYNCVPTMIDFLGSVSKIYSGADFNFAVLQDGKVYAWGANNNGVLGQQSSYEVLYPGVVMDLQNISKIVIDGYSCMALDKDGKVWSWGDNRNRRLGRNDEPNSYDGLTPAVNTDLPLALNIGFNRQFYIVTEYNRIIEIKETTSQP